MPILVHAKTNELAPIPAPPDVRAEGKITATPNNTAITDAAADNTSSEPSATPEPPELPMPVHSGEHLEPDITITRRGNEMIQEFRENGVIYMVKIIPDKGPAYYLIDTNGDGTLDAKRSDIDRGINVNMWKVFEWK
ncbi:MAG: DUF2782 domain-containing protein [Methylococcales bacterium]|nr:DUF2782 domain-containing protein [Methylococcales bacterium]